MNLSNFQVVVSEYNCSNLQIDTKFSLRIRAFLAFFDMKLIKEERSKAMFESLVYQSCERLLNDLLGSSRKLSMIKDRLMFHGDIYMAEDIDSLIKLFSVDSSDLEEFTKKALSEYAKKKLL